VVKPPSAYRGRLAPSPTGWLHLGHARTFWVAWRRARTAGGTLALRIDDLDRDRVRPEFTPALLEDLAWFGFDWDEGPDRDGLHAPYEQSRRLDRYARLFAELRRSGLVYPCTCSRRDVQSAAGAPHEGADAADEPLYPGTCRPENLPPERRRAMAALVHPPDAAARLNWRFHVPDGETLPFVDGRLGAQSAVAGRHFGDFLVWRRDGTPSYQLACVADDADFGITEVVRGEDLVRSTFRQLLLYRALGRTAPAFYHCPLVTDTAGVRLAKRHDALALRTLRAHGRTPAELRAGWEE
jgi:glutamyl-tRNA synthetase